MIFRAIFLAFFWLFLFYSSASSRITEYWPYERLFKEADLVVIATAQKTTRAKERFEDDLWPLELVGLNTRFQVEHCVKGKLKKDKIVVLHFRFGGLSKKEKKEKTPREFIIDGPSFLNFRLKEIIVKLKDRNLTMPRPEYLLFLKRRKDGRYEPVSGRIDPVYSVREIFAPLEKDIGGARRFD
jgi:hypothetical protein